MFNKSSVMFKIIIVICIFNVILASGNDVKDESDRGAHSDRGALWFGPRLGKRSLQLNSEDNRQVFLRLLEAADALKFYYNQLPSYERQAEDQETKVTKKVIFTPKLGRNINDEYPESQLYENVDFTPRLGRRLPEVMPATPSDQDIYGQDPLRVDARGRHFSPRLGRTMQFSPRLGREVTYDNYPENIRVARSANKTSSN